MKRVLLAESAILLDLKAIRHFLLFFHRIVVSLLAFCTSQCDSCAHDTYLRIWFLSVIELQRFRLICTYIHGLPRKTQTMNGNNLRENKRLARCH